VSVAGGRDWLLLGSAVASNTRLDNVHRQLARRATPAHCEPVTAAVNRDNGREKGTEMTGNPATNAPCEAEIVDPAELAGASGRLLTRSQVARRLGTSLSTVRRMEGEQLKPIIGPRGVHYFEETEIQAVFVRVRRARMPDNERADGTLAAAAFRLFQGGADVVGVVKELREAPEKIETLLGHWKRLHGTVLLDAKSLASIASDLNADALVDESALLQAVAEFKKRNAQCCVLCEREAAYWCRNCAREAGRAEVQEREARKLF
jgi:hypothetical protein